MVACTLPIAVSSIRRAIKYRSIKFLLQRYAFGLPLGLGGRICVQCTGAGEIRGAAALVAELEASGHSAFVGLRHPTKWDMAHKNLPKVPCVYLPVDFGFVVRRWLQHIVPSAIVIVEAGIQPNFLAVANSSRPPIPAGLVNASLSRHLTAAPILARKTAFNIFHQMRCVLTRDEEDVEHFISLGARADSVKVLGNLKYSSIRTQAVPRPSGSIPYALAVSTREEEEKLIWQAWAAIPYKPLLVIIPRAPKRVEGLRKMFGAKKLNVGLHSRDLMPNPNQDIYFVDTFGETLPWIQHAEFVFVGGSLLSQYGGQNVLEPAALSRACIVGPYTKTFRSEVDALLGARGCVRVTDKNSLQIVFSRLLSNPKETRAIGMRGYDHVQTKLDTAKRYVRALHDYGVLSG